VKDGKLWCNKESYEDAIAEIISLCAKVAALEEERDKQFQRFKEQVDYSIKLQQLIESLKDRDTPHGELHHHHMIVNAKVALDAQQTRWTTEKPTKEGWYWWRNPFGEISIVEAVSAHHSTQMYVNGHPVGYVQGEFAGPLTPPPARTERETEK